jgi:GTP-binding protein Era
MNRTVTQVLSDVDLVLFVIESGRYGPADEQVVKLLPEGAKVILVVNKVDLLEDKARMLPFLQKMSAVYPFAEIVPVSAEKGRNTDTLLKAAEPYLPEGDPSSTPTTSPTAASASWRPSSCARSCSASSARSCPTA